MAVFLSDAHLQRASDAGYRALSAFLSRLQYSGGSEDAGNRKITHPAANGIPVTDLFLVGDIFDFWFSKGENIYPEFNGMIQILTSLKQKGILIHLLEGNHDFFLKPYFSDILGMTVHEDWTSLERDGRKMLIAHGDLVDTANVRYLALRRFLRSSFVFRLQKMLPLWVLWGIARRSSSASKEFMGGAEERIAEKMRQFAQGQFQKGFDAVIFGHCHKPEWTETMVADKPRVFVTLGDWVRHRTYLYYNKGQFTLERHG